LHSSFQTWIDIRYAEVLLNRAEAALELAQNGVASHAGIDMQTNAFEAVNQIRSRAGATLLSNASELSTSPAFERGGGPGGFVQAPNRGLQIIRVERYKELAFEHKLYWDLRRWFTFDTQIRDYRRRMLSPFLFANGATLSSGGNPDGKYIYDTRVCESANNSLNFQTRYYYERIPNGQINTNPLLIQNNQY
jgi:starch-binding outer membrane protein, SusD/RagB family